MLRNETPPRGKAPGKTPPPKPDRSPAAVCCDGQHGERHVPNAIRRRSQVFPIALLAATSAAQVGAIDRLQLVHVVILGTLKARAQRGAAYTGFGR